VLSPIISPRSTRIAAADPLCAWAKAVSNAAKAG